MNKTAAISLPFLLLACAVLTADESALEARFRDAVARADGALVTVQGSPRRWVELDMWPHADARRALQLTATLRNDAATADAAAVRAGEDLVLAPYAAVGESLKITVTLANGKRVDAVRVDGDAELGVAVLRLPTDEDAPALEPVADWKRLRRGSLGVFVGPRGALDVTLVRASSPSLGTVNARAEGGGVLVGADGALLGLRAAATTRTTAHCSQCHVRGDPQLQLTPLRFAEAHGAVSQLCPSSGAQRELVYRGDTFVPGPVLRRVLDDVRAHGRIQRGFLGVVLGDVPNQGIVVTSVIAESPAAKAGLRKGARIRSLDGAPCTNSFELSRGLALRRPGDEVAFGLRDGETVTVTLGDRSAVQTAYTTPASLGLEVLPLDPSTRAFLDIGDDVAGVLVKSVDKGSAAARAGLRRGDVIVRVGETEIDAPDTLRAAVAGAEGRVNVEWRRDGGRVFRPLAIPKAAPGETR